MKNTTINPKTKNVLYILFIATFLFPSVLFAQRTDEERIRNYIKKAEENYEKAINADKYRAEYFFELAIDNYEAAIRIDPDIPDVYFQLCKCYIGYGNIKKVKYRGFSSAGGSTGGLVGKQKTAVDYLKKYKEIQPNDKAGIAELENDIKIATGAGFSWNKQALQYYDKLSDIEYQYANVGFVRDGVLYNAPLHGITFAFGGGYIWSFLGDIGIYYIPYGENTFWDFMAWSYRIGAGVRYIHKYPMFSVGELCFRYTGYAGLAVEGLVDGGDMYGDSGIGFFNAAGYKLSSGLFISSENIPKGFKIEGVYQGHWSFSKTPILQYKPYFGIQVGILIGN